MAQLYCSGRRRSGRRREERDLSGGYPVAAPWQHDLAGGHQHLRHFCEWQCDGRFSCRLQRVRERVEHRILVAGNIAIADIDGIPPKEVIVGESATKYSSCAGTLARFMCWAGTGRRDPGGRLHYRRTVIRGTALYWDWAT